MMTMELDARADDFPEFAAVTRPRATARAPGPPAWAALTRKQGAPQKTVERAYVPPSLPSCGAYRFARHQELWAQSANDRAAYDKVRTTRLQRDAAERRKSVYAGKLALGRMSAFPRDARAVGEGPCLSATTRYGPVDLGGGSVLDWTEMAEVCHEIVQGGATGGSNRCEVAKRLNDRRVRPAKALHEYLRMPDTKPVYEPAAPPQPPLHIEQVDPWADYVHETPGPSSKYVLDGSAPPDNGRTRHFEALAHLIASKPRLVAHEPMPAAKWEYDMDMKTVAAPSVDPALLRKRLPATGLLTVSDWRLLAPDGTYLPSGYVARKDFSNNAMPKAAPSKPMRVHYGLSVTQASTLNEAERHAAVLAALKRSSQLHSPAVLSEEFRRTVRMRADLDYMAAPHRKRRSRSSNSS